MECVEQIPSWAAVAYFLPGRAKDLSAPLVPLTLNIHEISTLLAQCFHAFHMTVNKNYYFLKQLYLSVIMQADCVLCEVRN